jgi:carbon monoxide dehydrogenase subunit G
VKLEHEFEVEAPVETVWAMLSDLERVAPCLPGGEVTEKLGDGHYKASVKVKLGPVSLVYRGEIELTDLDESDRRSVMRAKANEARGQGTASATITTRLHPNGGRTRAEVETDLHVTGRVAQMGRGIVQDASNRLMGQFAECLSQRAAADAPAAAQAEPVHGFGLLVHALADRLGRLLHRHP